MGVPRQVVGADRRHVQDQDGVRRLGAQVTAVGQESALGRRRFGGINAK